MKFTAASNQRTADFVPHRPCQDTLYAPYPFIDPDSGQELVYSMGGRIDNAPFDDGTPGPEGFVDKIFVSLRQADGTYSAPKFIIGPQTFPWMNTPAKQQEVQENHPAWYVASVGSPNVFKIDGTCYMRFTASVNDPALGTGEHDSPDKQAHWSFFVAYMATSSDGVQWRLVNGGRYHENPALAFAQIYREPTEADKAMRMRPENPHDYKGISSISSIVADGYIYDVIGCWMAGGGQKNGLIRTKIGSNTPEISRVGMPSPAWEPLADGVLPDWFNDQWAPGNIHAWLASSISLTGVAGEPRFTLTFEAAGQNFGKNGLGNGIALTLSDDVASWPTPTQLVEAASVSLPGGGSSATFNCTGANGVVKNPVYFLRNGRPHFLFATSDHDGDGRPDCPGDLGGYVGLAIHELAEA